MHTIAPRAPLSVDSRAGKYRSIALRALASLANGDQHPGAVHCVRTHLRRLQAYLELIGEDRNAAVLAKCVSRLSRLRSLQVFRQYLAKIGAAPSDIDKVNTLIEETFSKLQTRQTFSKIERLVWKHTAHTGPAAPNWLLKRQQMLRRVHSRAIEKLIAAAKKKPRRKHLHALRLRIKSLRYQEEWTSEPDSPATLFVKRLKTVQAVLGRHEELAEFRKLSKKRKLDARPRILKDWRRARKRARALATQLGWIAETLMTSRLPTDLRGDRNSAVGQ